MPHYFPFCPAQSVSLSLCIIDTGRWPWPSVTTAGSLSLTCDALPGGSSFQHTLITAAPLIFARTLPSSRMFSGSPLSTKLNHKYISLLVFCFCHLATTKFSPFIYFPPSRYSATRMSGYCPNMPGTLSLLGRFLRLEMLPSLRGPSAFSCGAAPNLPNLLGTLNLPPSSKSLRSLLLLFF